MYPIIKSFKSTRAGDACSLHNVIPTLISIFVSNICANSKEDNSYLYNNYVPIN